MNCSSILSGKQIFRPNSFITFLKVQQVSPSIILKFYDANSSNWYLSFEIFQLYLFKIYDKKPNL